MAQLLSLSRAARLVGVTRSAVQKKIKTGVLTTFEGMVHPADLLRAFPHKRFKEQDLVLERMNQIKENAFAKRTGERLLPDAHVLTARLSELGKELAAVRDERDRYKRLVGQLDERLRTIAHADTVADEVPALRHWLRDEVQAGSLDTSELAALAARDDVLRLMTAQIKLLPSGHEFFVEGADTILDAALRAGYSVDYGCSNGNCGRCKARVLSGEVKKIRFHDYVLPDAEKRAGVMLLCSNTAISDVVVEAVEATGSDDIPVQSLLTRVKKLERPVDDMIILHLQTPRAQRLRFLAGQSAHLSAGEGVDTDVALASCPCDDRNLQVQVCAEDAPFSKWAFQQASVGDRVALEGPHGDFVLREEDSTVPLIFIAFDTGFAPIKSLVEHAMSLESAESLHLYWIAAQDGHYMHNLCRSWSDALDNFSYESFTTTDRYDEILRRIAESQFELAGSHAYVAGDGQAVATARRVLCSAGLPQTQLFTSP